MINLRFVPFLLTLLIYLNFLKAISDNDAICECIRSLLCYHFGSNFQFLSLPILREDRFGASLAIVGAVGLDLGYLL
jgi:hypothetical protein